MVKRVDQQLLLPQNSLEPTIRRKMCIRDSPWDAPISTDAKVIGKENPIGLKGVMTFKVPSEQLKIRLRLLHARGSKFSSEGKVSPFYQPSIWTANGQYDLDFTFELNVEPKN